jgi:hypothetical protein
MRFLNLLALLFLAHYTNAQTRICTPDTSRKKIICLELEYGIYKKVDYKDVKYNYVETDSLGDCAVLGNIKHGVAQGNWIFFLGDITYNGKVDWFMGKVEDGVLEGNWNYSCICVRWYKNGIDTNPNPCPNI